MQNEPNKSLEQRVAKLESCVVNTVEVSRNLCTIFCGLAAAILECKNDYTVLISQQGDMLKMILALMPDEPDFKAEILTLIRRGESRLDQKEALFADLQKQMELLKQRLPKPFLPPGPAT